MDTTKKIFIQGYGNSLISTLGIVKCNIKIDEVECQVEINVVPDYVQTIPLLVGRTFTEQPHVRMIKNYTSLQLLRELPEPKQKNEVTKVALWAEAATVIPPNHLCHIPITTKSDYTGDVFVEASLRLKENQECCVPRVVLTVNSKVVESVLPMLNLSEQDIIIRKDDLIARAWPCVIEQMPREKVMKVTTTNLPELPADQVKHGPLDEKEQRKLMSLLQEYRDCFSQNYSDLGCIRTGDEMDIQLTEDKPFTFRPYRMSYSEKEKVKTMLEELLDSGIIRESQSNYCSPLLLVKKKDGTDRMCIDYRKLNKLTVKDKYPLPRIDDQLDRLQGSKFFTSLDMKSGYHQIPIKESSKRFTAFVTPEGCFEFNRVPFGLTNAPAVFQRVINKVLAAAKSIAAIYLDDVLIHSKTTEEGLNHLKLVLNLFREAGLTLNLDKCTFLMTNIAYLGFEINSYGIKPGEAKTLAVKEFKPPTNIHEVRQYLGLTGYFRQFIKNYALIAKALTAKIKKDQKWTWDGKAQDAFEKLKEALITRPVLALYNPTFQTEVVTV